MGARRAAPLVAGTSGAAGLLASDIPAILAGTHHLSSHKPATLDDILEMIFGDDDDLEDEFPFLGPNPFIRRSPSSPFMFREKLRRGYPGQSGFSMGGGFSGVIEILQIMIAAQKARAAAAEAAAAKKPAQPDTDAPAAEEHGDQVNG